MQFRTKIGHQQKLLALTLIMKSEQRICVGIYTHKMMDMCVCCKCMLQAKEIRLQKHQRPQWQHKGQLVAGCWLFVVAAHVEQLNCSLRNCERVFLTFIWIYVWMSKHMWVGEALVLSLLFVSSFSRFFIFIFLIVPHLMSTACCWVDLCAVIVWVEVCGNLCQIHVR